MANNATLLTKPQQGRQPGVTAIVPANGQQEVISSRLEALANSTSRDRVIVESVRTGAREIIGQLGNRNMGSVTSLEFMTGTQRFAKDRGMTFSEVLESLDPSYQYAGTELDGT